MRAVAHSVVKRLQQAGHVALFAGGCVRDMLMGKRPSDYDVATSAPPEQVITLFRRTQQVGAKFGVVLVRTGGHSIEVATFRRDFDYADGRRPTAVQFTNAREDAVRRDFTINGMFYDPIMREVVDYVDGRRDIRRKVIRAIGDPDQRFKEDHLRLLRAVRFAARLDFKIDSATWEAMKCHAAHIARISPERIREELEAMLTHPSRARALEHLFESGVFAHLWPSAPSIRLHRDRVTKQLSALPKDSSFHLALAVVMSPLAGNLVVGACAALRTSNETKKVVVWLHKNQFRLSEPDKLSLADLKLLMAHPAFDSLRSMFAAYLHATGASPAPLREIAARVRRISPNQIAPPTFLTGHDLEKMGLAKGPIYKRILDLTYYQQLNSEITNHRAAKAYAQRLISDDHPLI